MIKITDPAAKKIKQQLEKRGSGLGIKIGVKTTGCSGLAYVLEYVDTVQDLECHVANDINFYIDPKHTPYLNGMTVDYVRSGLNEGFDFKNPNERDRCGCGISFRV